LNTISPPNPGKRDRARFGDKPLPGERDGGSRFWVLRNEESGVSFLVRLPLMNKPEPAEIKRVERVGQAVWPCRDETRRGLYPISTERQKAEGTSLCIA